MYSVCVFSEINIGNIVIFEYDGHLLVKRVVALPCESVDLSTLIYIRTLDIPVGEAEIFIVSEGCYYFLGDNAHDVIDSGYWDAPFVTGIRLSQK